MPLFTGCPVKRGFKFIMLYIVLLLYGVLDSIITLRGFS